MGIFKQQTFKCGGCGKTLSVKATVPPEAMQEPLMPPKGWGNAQLTLQNPQTGAVAVLLLPVCTEECGKGIIEKGQGAAAPLVSAFMRLNGGEPEPGFEPPSLVTP